MPTLQVTQSQTKFFEDFDNQESYLQAIWNIKVHIFTNIFDHQLYMYFISIDCSVSALLSGYHNDGLNLNNSSTRIF